VTAGLRPAAVRLDSGDLAALAKGVRQIFDAAGLTATRIYVSGDLDEWSIARLLADDAPVDGFGVGTALSTSKDAPALGGIYKLVEIERSGTALPVMKLSGGKASYPGRKQVWRHFVGGRAVSDTVALAPEPGPEGCRPLMRAVIQAGRLIEPLPSLEESRRVHAARLAELPDTLRALDAPDEFPVRTSDALEALTAQVKAGLEQQLGI
jgi:nicotinate phosphoribosyltransferase